MISTLTGTISYIEESNITINVNGVGYLVHCPINFLNHLHTRHNAVETVFIHTHVREDQISLFGFPDASSRRLFLQLISVSGIGPKIGLAILSKASANEIAQAISTADVEFFTRVPGLGKKGAQKIIVDLKNKLGSLAELDLAETHLVGKHELIEALISLGYTRAEAEKSASQVPSEITDLQQQLKHSLQILGKK